ncbi:Ig-like domain-containing protein [Catenovulum maritimum]|uniref:Big-1 domain-containing protein n=1 Tax=Catenovulum maritimum TaxID=1513271 RepID=A0A0J8GUG2_9ALTE|nr:Ig-like domain-containing protein [Catenovulum maritimum]KMT66387.1 hypothetical protein XM47_03945 [Catenovulum maritimum]
MLKQYRYWLVTLFITLLSACSGGGTLEDQNSEGSTEESVNYSLTLSAVDNTGQSIEPYTTSVDNKLTVTATLLANGSPASNQIINFGTSAGSISPSTSVATNTSGQAIIVLSPGTEVTADVLTVSYTPSGESDITQTLNYTSAGGGSSGGSSDNVILTGNFFKCPADFDAEPLTVNETNCTIKNGDNGVNNINSIEPIYLVIRVMESDNTTPVADAIVNASTSLASLNVSSTLTNSTGYALFRLNGNGVASADAISISSNDVTQNFNYQVSTTQIPSETVSSDYSIVLELLDVETNTVAINQVSAANKGLLKATVMKNGAVLPANEIALVSFNANVGILSPSSARAITSNGIATIALRAGSVPDAGSAQASIEVATGTVSSNTILYTSAGDDINIISDRYQLDLRLVEKGTENDINTVSTSVQGELIARLTDSSSNPVENAVIQFTTSLGNLFPQLGTAITNEQGVATLDLTPGSVKGAGQLTATFETAQAFEFFESAGDEIEQDAAYDVTALMYDCSADGADKTNGTGCTLDTSVTLTQPRVLVIKVTEEDSGVNGTGIPNMLVNVTTDNGNLSPENGRILTNSNGFAYVDVNAGEGIGAGQLDITLPSSNASGTTTAFFQIGAANIAMGNQVNGSFEETVLVKEVDGTTDLASLAPGRTATLVVNIINLEDDTPYTAPIDVLFSSACASLEEPKAKIDSVVKSINGVAKATYVADGCESQDVVTATAIAGTRSLSANGTVVLDDVPADSVLFVSTEIADEVVTDNPVITFPGTGTADKATLTFKVLDDNNNPKAGQKVKFSLANDIGEINGLGGIELSPTEAISFTDGTVQVNVKSGRFASAIVVLAELVDSSDDLVAYAVSNKLSSTSGIADQNSFTFAAEHFNVYGWDVISGESELTVVMSDHTNHPVIDGTTVTFFAEGGNTSAGSCSTTNGVCTTTWRSVDPKPQGDNLDDGFCDIGNDNDPANDTAVDGKPCYDFALASPVSLRRARAGRVGILAYAFGEETFVDANKNGIYDAGETFYDLAEAHRDDNQDGVFCGIQSGLTPAPAPADPNTPFIDRGDVTFAPGVDEDDCFRTSSNADEYILLGAADEEFIDINNDQTYNKGNGIYNGLACTVENQTAGVCSRDLVSVRRSLTLVMSDDNARIRIIADNSEIDSSTGVINLCRTGSTDAACVTYGDGVSSVNFTVYLTDLNNNPMPAGTKIDVQTSNGELVGTTSFTVGETNTAIPQGFPFTVKREVAGEGNSVDAAPLTITITTEATDTRASTVTAYAITVVDSD